MTTMLEKMARAIYADLEGEATNRSGWVAAWIEKSDDLTDVRIDGTVDLRKVARAALLAIREPDDGVVDAGRKWLDFDGRVGDELERLQTRDAMNRMIDAILGDDKP